jgi:hypothetical protein
VEAENLIGLFKLLSPSIDDKNINSLKPIRLNPESEKFMNNPPTTENFKISLLICDDI